MNYINTSHVVSSHDWEENNTFTFTERCKQVLTLPLLLLLPQREFSGWDKALLL